MEAPEATTEMTAKTTRVKKDNPSGGVGHPAAHAVGSGPVALAPEAPKSGSKLILVGAAAFLLLSALVGAALVVALSGGEDEGEGEAVVITEPTPDPESLVRVDGAPEGARVMIDGVPAEAGQSSVPRDGRLHHVEVLDPEGEVLFERHVPVERDVTVYYAEARPPEDVEEPPRSEPRPVTMRSHPMMRPATASMSMSTAPSMMSGQVGEGEILTNF
jgi:hypothetical protein